MKLNETKYFKLLQRINLRSVYLNFKLFPINTAMKLPLLISNRTFIEDINKNSLILDCKVVSGLIQIGYGNLSVFDYKKSRSVLKINGSCIFKGHVRIGHGSKIIITKNGILELGNNFMINAESTIITTNKITIKNDVLLSWDVLIMDDDLHEIIDQETLLQINTSKEIIINNGVWVGARSLILKGSIIPQNSIISANSTVTGVYSEQNVIYGVSPLKILKRNVSWKL